MIIIEGPDGSGKSTLVRYLKDKTKYKIVKPYYPKVNQLSYYLHTPPLYYGHFLERYYISEIVYPKFKEGRKVMAPWGQFQIEAAILPYAPVILYLRPEKETIIRNIRNRGDDYISEHEVDIMLKEYDDTINKSFIPVIKYDFEKDNINSKIEESFNIHNIYDSRCKDLRKYLYSGSNRKGGIMIVGSDPSNRSVGNGYIRGFLSDKGSSMFLHKVLYEAGVYNHVMPYFTNFGKGFSDDKDKIDAIREEIEIIQPKKIIVLGKGISKKIGVDCEEIEHPSYVKRFSYNNYDWYIEKIKKLII